VFDWDWLDWLGLDGVGWIGWDWFAWLGLVARTAMARGQWPSVTAWIGPSSLCD
jgi:hypothetical protein